MAKIRRIGGDPDERMADKGVKRSRCMLDFYHSGSTFGLYWIHAVVWVSRRRAQDTGIRTVQSLERACKKQGVFLKGYTHKEVIVKLQGSIVKGYAVLLFL